MKVDKFYSCISFFIGIISAYAFYYINRYDDNAILVGIVTMVMVFIHTLFMIAIVGNDMIANAKILSLISVVTFFMFDIMYSVFTFDVVWYVVLTSMHFVIYLALIRSIINASV